MHIYIMRHGQSEDNAHKVVSGSRETPLSELGRHQVRIQAEKLENLAIDLIVCSPLRRALGTAEIVADHLKYPRSSIKVMEELRERNHGSLEGKSYATDEDDSGNTIAAELVEGVEPIEHLHSRVYAAFREIASDKKHKNVLIVCHMNVGRMLEVIVNDKQPLDMYSFPRLENAGAQKLI